MSEMGSTGARGRGLNERRPSLPQTQAGNGARHSPDRGARQTRARARAKSGSGPGGRSAAVADGSTFAPAMVLLPDGLRGDVERLYLVLRRLDDLADEDDPRAGERMAAVERWVRGGATVSAEARELAQLRRRHPAMRCDALLEFCAGMRHDIDGRGIEGEDDFERYCQQAGGTVGEVLASILGAVRDDAAGRREVEGLMAALGRAMQVTNILRDIDEDWARGRVYLPRSAIERHGFPAPGERAGLLAEWIPRADALYVEGERAIPLLADGQAAMALAAERYRGILRQIERDELGVGRG